VKSGRWNKGM